jgi:hypothetical protein
MHLIFPRKGVRHKYHLTHDWKNMPVIEANNMLVIIKNEKYSKH